MTTPTYTVSVCPLCGEQVEWDTDFGWADCWKHNRVAPVHLAAAPLVPFEPSKAWLVENPPGSRACWELVDPRTQNYGPHVSSPPRVVDEFKP